MKNKQARSNQDDDLRHQAEERLKESSNPVGPADEVSSDALALVHELQVDQIELEMQNDELKRAKLETEDALTKYSDLYEFAPIGLFTIDTFTRILEVNLTGATLLGVERSGLLNRRFEQFVEPKDRPILADFLQKVLKTGVKQTCELKLHKGGEPVVYIRIEGRATEDSLLIERRFRIAVTDITERRKAEEMLQQSEQHYRNLFESMDEGFALCEMIYDEAGKPADFRYLTVNPAFAKQTGLPVEQVTGRTVRELIPGIEPFWIETYGRVVKSGRSERIDNPVAALSKNYEVYVWRSGPGRFAVVFNDVTERKKADEALRLSEARLRLALSAANSGTWEWNLLNNENVWSDELWKLYGIKPHSCEPSYEAWRHIVLPDDRAKVEEIVQEAARNGSELNVEWRVIDPDGTERWLMSRGQPSLDSSSKAVRYIGIVLDITEHKLAEEELIKARDELEKRVLERTINLATANESLRESEERFRVAIKDSPITVFTQDREFRYTWIYNSPPGLSPNKILGKSDEDLFPADEAQLMTKIKAQVLETGIGARKEIKTTILGKTLFYDYTIEPLLDKNDEIVGITCAAMDLTIRKNVEEDIRKAKEAAEDAVRIKTEFLANMSHEIRTPMNAVIGMTSLLLDENLTLEQKGLVEIIRSSGDALMVVINDILDFSKLESDKVMMEEQPFELRSCVEEALDLVKLDAKNKGLNLAYTIDSHVPAIVIGDHTRLRQILSNLLSNAVKFTEKGAVKVSVSIMEDKTRDIHFSVQDTGIGVPKDKKDMLFQSFSQVDMSTTRKYGGTGLGLAISKKLVELMGGRIWDESEPGIGSTFHFTIPADSVFGKTRTLPERVQPQLVGRRVLIIDGDRDNRRALGLQTYSMGMSPVTVSSGEEALGWIRRGDDFDIVILDEEVLDMESESLAKEIRKDNDVLPLVMLTRLDQSASSDIFTASLTKPIRPFQLNEVFVDTFAKFPVRKSTQAKAVIEEDRISPQHISLRILLAEDNASSQKVASAMLKRLGYEADTVANGIEALQALELKHYDVVLMDVRMPEMDGLEATRIIRQRWPDDGPRVIAITAHALEGDKEKCFEAGMDDYIAKPMKLEDLKAALELVESRSNQSCDL